MGAKQRAQRRGKAAKGSQKGTPASQRKLNTSLHVPDLSATTRSNVLLGLQDVSSSPSERRAFTMGDTARNTERHMSGWGSSKLRGQGISFVSAGTLHQDPEHVRAQGNNDGGNNDANEEVEEENEESEGDSDEQQNVKEQEEAVGTLSLENNVKLVVPENVAQEGPTSGLSQTVYRSRSGSASTSSSESEQIVFAGRSKGVTPNAASLNPSKKTSRAQSPAVQASAKKEINEVKNSERLNAKPIPITQKQPERFEPEASSSDRRVTNSRLRRKGRRRERQSDLDEQEAIMRDYIANMAMDDTEDEEPVRQPINEQQGRWAKPRKNETIRCYDGSGEENMKVQVQSTGKKPLKGLDQSMQAMDWNSDDLEDFDDLSTSDEEVIEISQVLRYRERESGPQYLVTPIGLETSDAKWIRHERLISESAFNEIAIFEEIQAIEFEESLDEDEEDDDEETTDEEAQEALNDLIDHIESEDDENARILKHAANMTDEQLARALAKQEELGMGGDELMLFSGDVDGDDDDVNVDMDDAFRKNDNFISFSLKQHTSNRNRSKRNKKNRDSFPSAAAFADALDEDPYGGFDIMDFDRPSLRPRKKGRKSDFPFDLELEDEELRDHLVSTWMKDRDKKASRKREKEEARQAALLEYADRSDPAAIKAEIRRFLVQDMDTLRLCPMESATRASVHRLAKALKLNSHSEGKDGTSKGRYPVLTKTVRTPTYSIDSVWEIDALLNTRKFFPKNLGHKKEKLPRGTARAMRVRHSGGVQGASYMNGEVVGASAPEIGVENKGRAMLEKMGWVSGMAIGAEGNKGSLEAVKHVFKTSRAGLG